MLFQISTFLFIKLDTCIICYIIVNSIEYLCITNNEYMKKNLLKTSMVAAFILMMGTASAQISFFGRAGLNLNDLVLIDGDGKTVDLYKTGIGMQIGGGMNYSINDKMGVEVGLGYSQRGASFENSMDIGGITATTTGAMTLHYLDLPVSFVFSSEVGSGKLNFGVGPKFGIGLGGKNKFVTKVTNMGTTQETTTEDDLTFGSGDNDDFKRLDLGIGCSVSYEIANFHFGVQYYYGLTNHIPNPTGKESGSQNMSSIIVGYKFGN